MSFPTWGEVSSFYKLLELQNFGRLLLEARPDIADKVMGGPNIVTIDLPPHSNDSRPRVVLGLVTNARTPYWMISGATRVKIVATIWETSTDEAILVQAMLEMYDACLTKNPLPSPWCWAESTRSPIVQVAEILSDHGYDVDAVVSGNRMVLDRNRESDRSSALPVGFGDALRIDLDWGIATLSRKPTLGWVLDVSNHLTTRRLQFTSENEEEPSQMPGLMDDDIVHVSALVERTLRAGEWRVLEGVLPTWELRETCAPLHSAVAWWMRELGYGGTYALTDVPKVASSVNVTVLEKQAAVGLADVQRAFAQATIEEMKLFLFSDSGYTKNARAWANLARVPLFNVYGDEFALSAANPLAQERIPKIM